ncbi:MAG: 5'-methylthioadenosine/adenosylhomocysteine nucleosidase [Firmicutes bacterium]|nr:5'-methylthioadenosine/adenosylhomocysteine nucleosidase [Bacillota bacterium]
MLGIIGAMKVETDKLISALQNKKTTKLAGADFVQGTLHDKSVVVCQCGIGKVNSALMAAVMHSTFKVAAIINIGVAGGVAKGIKQGDIVIADKVGQHDYDLTVFGAKPGQIDGFSDVFFECGKSIVDKLTATAKKSGYKYFVGPIVSGDQFINDTKFANNLNTNFGAIACDMESGAIGHVCQLLGVPFAIMRAISDEGDDTALTDYDRFLQEAAERSFEVIAGYLVK